jgi:hypothetical protein
MQPGNHAIVSRVSARTPDEWKPSRRLRDALTSCDEAIEAIDEGYYVFNVNLGDPLTYKAAMKTKHAKACQDAVDVQHDTLRKNCT